MLAVLIAAFALLCRYFYFQSLLYFLNIFLSIFPFPFSNFYPTDLSQFHFIPAQNAGTFPACR